MTEKHIDPRRPPLGAEPGTLPRIHTTKIPEGSTIWGMVPIGVGSLGTAGKHGRHKANTKCPSSEYAVCYAFVNKEWHEVIREPLVVSDFDKAVAAACAASGASSKTKWSAVDGPTTGVGNEFYLHSKKHGTYYICVDQGEVTSCSPCADVDQGEVTSCSPCTEVES